MQNEKPSIESKIEIDINQIRKFAEQFGPKYYQIISIYLFGSVARGDADEESDIDLLFLLKEKIPDFLTILTHDENYLILEDWALKRLEGGINPLICDIDELANDFD
ncbi:MAG: nucleotidyltransferase family protein, partial [Promethearchaeota archaeon]